MTERALLDEAGRLLRDYGLPTSAVETALWRTITAYSARGEPITSRAQCDLRFVGQIVHELRAIAKTKIQ